MAYNISDWCELEVTKLWLMILNIKKKKREIHVARNCSKMFSADMQHIILS